MIRKSVFTNEKELHMLNLIYLFVLLEGENGVIIKKKLWS